MYETSMLGKKHAPTQKHLIPGSLRLFVEEIVVDGLHSVGQADISMVRRITLMAMVS